jgi:hypothetical protein
MQLSTICNIKPGFTTKESTVNSWLSCTQATGNSQLGKLPKKILHPIKVLQNKAVKSVCSHIMWELSRPELAALLTILLHVADITATVIHDYSRG